MLENLLRFAVDFKYNLQTHQKLTDPSDILPYFFHEGDIELMVPSAPCLWALSIQSFQPRHIHRNRLMVCETDEDLMVFEITIAMMEWIIRSELSLEDIDQKYVW